MWEEKSEYMKRSTSGTKKRSPDGLDDHYIIKIQ